MINASLRRCSITIIFCLLLLCGITPSSGQAPLSELPTEIGGSEAACLAEALRQVPAARKIVKGARCEVTKCKGTMTPIQCKAQMALWATCLAFQEFFSACRNGNGAPDDRHFKKIVDMYYQGIAKCARICGAGVDDVVETLIKRVPKNLGSRFTGECAKRALTTVGKVLGPIGVAITVGEVGALAIEIGGNYYSQYLDRKGYCDKLPSVLEQYKKATEKWQTTDFPYCTLHIDYKYDNIGVTSATITKTEDCDSAPINKCERGEVERSFQEFQLALHSFIRWQRLRDIYQKGCQGELPDQQ